MQQDQEIEWDYPEQNPDYQGDLMDPVLKNGPIEERNCTDCFFCILYILSLCMFIGIAIYAFQFGDPKTVFAPYNSSGQQCGVTNPYQDCPYAFINFENSIVEGIYCIKDCPKTDTDIISCNGVDYALSTYSTKSFQYVCQPIANQDYQQQYSEITRDTGIENTFNSVEGVWPIALGVCFIALFIAMILSELIKEFASCVVWVSYLLFVLLLITLGFICFYYANDYPVAQGWLKGLAYTSWSFAFIAIIMLFCLCKKIRLAVAVLKAAVDFTRECWTAVLLPFGMFLVSVIYFIIWMLSSIYLVACGTQQQINDSPYPSINVDSSLIWLLVANLFSFYWNCYFAVSFVQYVIGSACSMWYFKDLGKDLHHAVGKSITQGLTHHSGSIALGGLILTLVKFIQLIFKCFYSCVKDATITSKKKDGCFRCCCGCCGYLISYFEEYIRFIDQNAFIMMAIKGEPFCKSAHSAYYLIKRNSMLVDVTDGIGEMFCIISNLFIGLSATFAGFMMVTGITQYQTISPIMPSIFFIVIALVIASFFMNVYGIGIDTILLCYLIDEELYKEEGGAKSIQQYYLYSNYYITQFINIFRNILQEVIQNIYKLQFPNIIYEY